MTAAEYKATRERLGTQAEVACLLGVNRVTVAKRESGAVEITKEAGLALARIFAICDGVADSGQTIRTEKEGRDAARAFLGLRTNKLDAFLRKGV